MGLHSSVDQISAVPEGIENWPPGGVAVKKIQMAVTF